MSKLPPCFICKSVIRDSNREEINSISDIRHPSVRACLQHMNLDDGIEIVHTADIPARSGIGSSSAFTVGLLHSINAYQGRIISKKMLAEKAIFVEQKMIKENVGSQDQIACAFGGLNKIEFFKHEDCNFVVSPITLDRMKLDFLQSYVLVFYT